MEPYVVWALLFLPSQSHEKILMRIGSLFPAAHLGAAGCNTTFLINEHFSGIRFAELTLVNFRSGLCEELCYKSA
ncbi:MAG: hypothetical protein R3B84_02910 [Zavarzinella sp.]